MAAFSQESLARIGQAILPHKDRFTLTSDRIGMSFAYGEHLEISADEEGYLCRNYGERSVATTRFPDEESAVTYFLRFVPLALRYLQSAAPEDGAK